LTCVIAPISNTAGFPISADEAGEAVPGVGSDEALDMPIQISQNKNWFYLAENSRRTEVKMGQDVLKEKESCQPHEEKVNRGVQVHHGICSFT
jgi:hypothetical protein